MQLLQQPIVLASAALTVLPQPGAAAGLVLQHVQPPPAVRAPTAGAAQWTAVQQLGLCMCVITLISVAWARWPSSRRTSLVLACAGVGAALQWWAGAEAGWLLPALAVIVVWVICSWWRWERRCVQRLCMSLGGEHAGSMSHAMNCIEHALTAGVQVECCRRMLMGGLLAVPAAA